MISSVDPAALHLHPGVGQQLGQLTAQMTQLQLNPNATVPVNTEGSTILNSQVVCQPGESYDGELVKDVSQEFLPPPPGFSTTDSKFQSKAMINDSTQHIAVVTPQCEICELNLKPVESVCALPVIGGIQFGVPYITCQDGLYPLMSQSTYAVPATHNASGSIVFNSSDVV